MKGGKYSGGKGGEEIITDLAVCNMNGSKEILHFIVGKSAKPTCFQKIRTLPVDYAFSKKS